MNALATAIAGILTRVEEARRAGRILPRTELSIPCTTCLGRRVILSDYPPDHELYGTAVPCPDCVEAERRQQERDRLLEQCGLLRRQRRETFAKLDALLSTRGPEYRKAYAAARAFSEAPEGWLLFCGSHGLGKTSIAAAVTNDQIDRGRPVIWAKVPDLLDWLRATYRSGQDYDARLSLLRSIDLLVLDELGVEHATGWSIEQLYKIIDHRIEDERPTIVTTNLHPRDFKDARIASRLQDKDLVRIFPFEGKDQRLS